MKIIELKSIDSTNKFAMEIAKNTSENTVIIAEKQTNGYGTKKQPWYSDGDSIICSFLIFPKNIKNIDMEFSYKVGKVISESINELLNLKTVVKRPNDIYLENKKMSGILVETEYFKNALKYIIIGVGINVNQEEFPPEISDIATSIYISTGEKREKKLIITELIKRIEDMNL